MQVAMIDDKIVPLAELEPIYNDRGIYFGDGVRSRRAPEKVRQEFG
jgi:hypothetical protein